MTATSVTPTTAARWSKEGTKRGTVIAGLSGILFAVLSVARVLLTGEFGLPPWEAPTTEILDFYHGLTFDAKFMIGFGMVSIGWLLYLVFVAKFSSIIGNVDAGSGWVGHLIVSLAVINVALVFPYLIALSTGAILADAGGVGPDSFLILHGVVNGVVWFALLTDALLWVAIGVTILISRAFPRWLGIAFVITSAVEIFAFFGPVEMWTLVGGLVYLWTLLLGLTMLIRADRYSTSR
jgi:hypothetical protein